MTEMRDYLHKVLLSDSLQFTITQVTQMTGVSGSQLRYWERKGFIKSAQSQKNKNHFYNFKMLLRISTIKYYLDQGFTLKSAAAQEEKHKQIMKIYHQFLDARRFNIVQNEDGQYEIILGTLEDDPKTQVYMTLADNQTHLHLRHIS